MEWEYKVILTGGDRDGEILAYFMSYRQAVNYCNAYYLDHAADLHPVWGGLMIFDNKENYVQW